MTKAATGRSPSPSLTKAFEEASTPKRLALSGPEREELERRLWDLVERGRARWPDVTWDPAEFVRHVAGRLKAEGGALAGVSRVHGEDLLLAWLCVKGE